MKKMRIGVFIEESILQNQGGGFSYTQRLIEAIDHHQFPDELDVCFITIGGNETRKSTLATPIFRLKQISNPFFRILMKLAKTIRRIPLIRHGAQKLVHWCNHLETRQQYKELIQANVHIIHYTTPETRIDNYPCTLTNWDIGHRSMAPFPEVSMNGTHEYRENRFRNQLTKAYHIFVESKEGKEQLHHFFQIPLNRITILPMFPGKIVSHKITESNCLQLIKEAGLEKKHFFFYPAQFWSHKNHRVLVEALSIIRDAHPTVRLVFSGSDKGNRQYIEEIAQSFGVSTNIDFLGFVSDDLLKALYTNAIALVMPTYLGPTNMPVLEAASLGTPVLCSNLGGHVEQLGQYAEYIDPNKPDEWATRMQIALKNKSRPEAVSFPVSVDILAETWQNIKNERMAFGFNYNQ